MTLEERLKYALRALRWKSSMEWITEPKQLMEHHIEQFAAQLLPLFKDAVNGEFGEAE